DGGDAVDVPLDDVATKPVARLHRQLEVDAVALLDGTQSGDRERLVHRLGLEAVGGDRGCGEAAAVDGDRVALGDLRSEPGGDAQAGALVAPVNRFDGAQVFDQAGEHVTTP